MHRGASRCMRGDAERIPTHPDRARQPVDDGQVDILHVLGRVIILTGVGARGQEVGVGVGGGRNSGHGLPQQKRLDSPSRLKGLSKQRLSAHTLIWPPVQSMHSTRNRSPSVTSATCRGEERGGRDEGLNRGWWRKQRWTRHRGGLVLLGSGAGNCPPGRGGAPVGREHGGALGSCPGKVG
jgi:hypothetical protein